MEDTKWSLRRPSVARSQKSQTNWLKENKSPSSPGELTQAFARVPAQIGKCVFGVSAGGGAIWLLLHGVALEGTSHQCDQPLRSTPASLRHLVSGRSTLGEARRQALPSLLMDPVTSQLERLLGAWDLQAEAGP